MNNLEKNSKIEIRTDGRKSYDIILKDSFDDFLKQMEFLEIEHKKICIVTESNVDPAGLRDLFSFLSKLRLVCPALRAFPCVRGEGWYRYPQRALRVAETPDGRLSKRLICRFLRSGSLH